MRSIINGRRYDTATAEEIASWENSYGKNDYKHCCETLYHTKKGAYFLHGAGGGLSSYARPVGDGGLTWGQTIRVLSPTDAQEWLEERGLTDALERMFGDTIEDA